MLQSPTGPSSWLRVSPLEVLISRACEPSLHEPNYALHLEVAEYINQKKANNPREAAMMIARLANHRNPHVAILSLALLDTLVQSCGYPFHLQISTKEFLNELVRRFPERPPPFPGPVMSRILELINGWKEGICVDSRWKEDLGNIRDMHRLLTFKGYRFRDVSRTSNAATNATANLKTADELEEEDRAAQSAKLQELIRRGTPRDLAAAQELMKSLAGANPDAKPDYRSQALTELNKLEQKVVLLNEMLDNVDAERGERFASGDAYDQVSSILTAARPKIQKWVSDAETDDPESLDTFLQINDQINTVIARYEAFKKGDYTFAANPIPQELGGSSTGLSLIDFDDSTPAPVTESAGNDLSGLFSSPPPAQQPQQQQQSFGMQNNFGMMGFQQQPQQQQQQQQSFPTHAPTPMFHSGGGLGGRPLSMSPPQPTQSATPPASIVLPGTPQPAPSSQAPNYFSNSNNNTGKAPINSGMGMGMGMGIGMSGLQNQSHFGGGNGVGFGQTQMYGGSPPLQQQPQPQQMGYQTSFGHQSMQPSNLSMSSNANPNNASAVPPAQGAAGQQGGKDPFADLAGLF